MCTLQAINLDTHISTEMASVVVVLKPSSFPRKKLSFYTPSKRKNRFLEAIAFLTSISVIDQLQLHLVSDFLLKPCCLIAL